MDAHSIADGGARRLTIAKREYSLVCPQRLHGKRSRLSFFPALSSAAPFVGSGIHGHHCSQMGHSNPKNHGLLSVTPVSSVVAERTTLERSGQMSKPSSSMRDLFGTATSEEGYGGR
jgi:hypothetical protein